MGVHIGHVAVAFCVLSTAGCGVLATPTSEPTSGAPVGLTTPSPQPTEPTPAPYVDAEPELANLASRFVRASLSYDSCAPNRSAFPDQVTAMATAKEVPRLRASGRAHLRWWVLCQRNEQATVRIHGATQGASTDRARTVYVEAVRTTRSDISTARDFVDVTLTMIRRPNGWRVDSARGGGL